VRLLRSPPLDAAHNMALDEAMLRTAADDDVTLVRLYAWETPSVSFGRNQRTVGIYSPERCAIAGVPAVRRLTGGRALLHGRELTYAVAAPVSRAATLRGGYDAINDLLLDALHRLGVPALRATPAVRLAPPGLAPCFETPATGELVLDGAKLVGSAQHRDARAFLQHGSILLDDDQGLLTALAEVPLPPVPPPATLRSRLGPVSLEAVADALAETLRETVTGTLDAVSDARLPAHHVELALSRYRDPLWTWRR
jgi:lipoyl(octanoyl) transferase